MEGEDHQAEREAGPVMSVGASAIAHSAMVEPPLTTAAKLAPMLQAPHRLILLPQETGAAEGRAVPGVVPSSGDVLQGVSAGQRVDLYL
jgi:hypothetical protein